MGSWFTFEFWYQKQSKRSVLSTVAHLSLLSLCLELETINMGDSICPRARGRTSERRIEWYCFCGGPVLTWWNVSIVARQDQDIRQHNNPETASDSSPASISFDDDDEEADATAADESLPLYFDETQPESSADVSVSNSSSTRIHVNPRSETDVTSRSSCDFNANVPSCPAQEPHISPVPQSGGSPEALPGRFYEEDPDEERPDEEEDSPCATSSKVIHGCSFRLLYHGLSEIDELQPDSSAASGCWERWPTFNLSTASSTMLFLVRYFQQPEAAELSGCSSSISDNPW